MENEKTKKPWKTIGIIGLVLGCVFTLLSLIPLIGAMMFYPAIISLILGIASLMLARKHQGKMTLGALTIVFSLISGGIAYYQASSIQSAIEEGYGNALDDLNEDDLDDIFNDILDE